MTLGREAPRRPLAERPRGDRPAAVAAGGRAPDRRRRWPTLIEALVARGAEHASSVMPGTTHARSAQPVTLGHHLLAHAWALLRDLDRLGSWAVRTSTSPAGRRRRGHLDPRSRPRPHGGAAGFPPRVRQLDRRRERPRLRAGVRGRRRDLRDAPLPPGRGPRPVDGRGAGLGRARRGLLHGVQHDAAEAEPRHGRARAREGGQGWRRLRGPGRAAPGAAARLPPRPPGGQGAGVRRRRHAGAGVAGPHRRGRLDPHRRRGDARGLRERGPLRHGSRRGARPRRRAVPRGAPAHGRAAEGARRGEDAGSPTSTTGSGPRSA